MLVRLLLLSSLAVLGMLFVFGVMDDRTDLEDSDGSLDRVMFWRAIGLAYLISALASAAFIAATAVVDHLGRAP